LILSLMYNKRSPGFLLFILLLLVTAGCQRPFELRPRSEIVNEVLLSDPSFSVLLDKKAKIDEETISLRSTLNDRTRLLSEEIAKLKQELSKAKEETDERIKAINAELDPYREELKKDIDCLVAELKLKESNLSSANKAIARLNKLSDKGSAPEDRGEAPPAWADEISSLHAHAQELEKDISSLRKKIRLNRLKLKMLK
jgi:chromosome segregation ATPase